MIHSTKIHNYKTPFNIKNVGRKENKFANKLVPFCRHCVLPAAFICFPVYMRFCTHWDNLLLAQTIIATIKFVSDIANKRTVCDHA